MPRIVGVDIPKGKMIDVALTYIYGIGLASSKKLLDIAGIKHEVRAKDLTEEEVSKLTGIIQKETQVEGDLRRFIGQNIKRFIEIGCWRGLRHKRGLPVRGQRTQTNARTRKGPRKTVGGAKKAKVATATKAG